MNTRSTGECRLGAIVRCARDGVVAGVRQDSDRGGPGQSFVQDANYVLIRHADGTFGEYYHLKRDGALVKLGQHVVAGQPIALSGNTGETTGPHLHFDVFNTSDELKKVTIPVTFRTGTGEIVTPQEGQEYVGAAFPETPPLPSPNPDVTLWHAVRNGDLARAKAALGRRRQP